MTDEHAAALPTQPRPRPADTARHMIDRASGPMNAVARQLLGDSPGVRAFATGILWVVFGQVMLIVGIWLTTLLSFEVTATKFFAMLSVVYSAFASLVILCGVMTMLAGAVRYGTGATDR